MRLTGNPAKPNSSMPNRQQDRISYKEIDWYNGNQELPIRFPYKILEVTKEIDINAISLNSNNSGDFSLKINCALDEHILNCIKPIIARNKLTMKQEDRFLVIYSTDR